VCLGAYFLYGFFEATVFYLADEGDGVAPFTAGVADKGLFVGVDGERWVVVVVEVTKSYPTASAPL